MDLRNKTTSDSGQFLTVPWVSLIPRFHYICHSATPLASFPFYLTIGPRYWTGHDHKRYCLLFAVIMATDTTRHISHTTFYQLSHIASDLTFSVGHWRKHTLSASAPLGWVTVSQDDLSSSPGGRRGGGGVIAICAGAAQVGVFSGILDIVQGIFFPKFGL